MLVAVMLFAACAPTEEAEAPSEEAEAPAEEAEAPAEEAEAPAEEAEAAEEEMATREVNKVCGLFPGPITDQSWSSLGKAALDAIGELFDAETAYQDSVQPADYLSATRDFATQDCDVVLGHGEEYNPTFTEVQAEYPDVLFVCFGADSPGGNMAVAGTNEAHLGFMPGFIAGKMTTSNKVGVVGGADYPGVIAQIEGFRQGAEYANSANVVTVTYTGSMEDVAKAKEAANALIDAGNDVLFHLADNAGVGVIEACEEKDVYCVGFGSDQTDLAPENVITSVHANLIPIYSSSVSLWASGAAIDSGVIKFGLDAPVAVISRYDNSDLVPADILAEAEEVQQMVVDGEIEPVLYFEKQD